MTVGAPPQPDEVRPKRRSAPVLDMLRSLALLVAIIAVTLIFVPGLIHPSDSQRVQPVSYDAVVTGFRQVTGLDAAVPSGLGSGWRANSVKLTHESSTATLYIGWVTPSDKFAGLYESNAAPIKVSASRPGDVTERRKVGPLRIVVTGSATPDEIRQLLEALRR